ncbi:hypothetical protein PsYK624_170490 [Phanerochaete sordida]|uniref:Uncharacterized protein n=1 Tax=Phanerochaete sordida TaxID=48140 RepID=A0A9P3GSK1_9APHY|nr:hypothetical protein PsYK624_170490 [Phanerochaete sordida]
MLAFAFTLANRSSTRLRDAFQGRGSAAYANTRTLTDAPLLVFSRTRAHWGPHRRQSTSASAPRPGLDERTQRRERITTRPAALSSPARSPRAGP